MWSYDADKWAKGHSFSGVPGPNDLVRIIDGFLSEQEKLFNGDVTNLTEMREYLQNHLLPMYQMGQQIAHQHWINADSQEQSNFMKFNIDDFRNLAKQNAPMDAKFSQQNWFIEGFCRQWRQEELEYYRRQFQAED